MNKVTLPTSKTASLLTRNNVDVVGADSFLDDYIKQRLEESTNLGYNALTSTLELNETDNNNILNVFQKLNYKLDCSSNCIADAASMIDVKSSIVNSYFIFDDIQNHKFSLLDVFSCSYKQEVQKIKYLMRTTYPLLLINTYKFKMMEDFYNHINLPQTYFEIIYKLYVLTLKSVVGNVEACDAGSLSETDVTIIRENLSSLPSLEFCKNWMEMHQLSCIFESKVDNTCILYNYEKHKTNIYIHFEFHSKKLTILKSAKLTQ